MTNNTPTWSQVTIKFQTASIMPAPYAYFYTLILENRASQLGVELDMRYLDRDELDEDSILDEGFTMNDDYSWKGQLPQQWAQVLESRLLPKNLSRKNRNTDNDNFIEIELKDAAGNVDNFFPVNIEDWDYFQHEMIQAVFEASGKEMPFELEYFEIEQNSELQMLFKASFTNRTLLLQLNDSEKKLLPWEKTQVIMQTIFTADFVEEEAMEDLPENDGKYLNIGDGLWYEFGKSILEPTPKSKILPKILKLLDQLREQTSF